MLAALGLLLAACSLKLVACSLTLGALNEALGVLSVEPGGVHGKVVGNENFLISHTSPRNNH